MGIDQVLAFRMEQQQAMLPGVLEIVLTMLGTMLPPHGNWSDYYPDFYPYHNDTYPPYHWWDVTGYHGSTENAPPRSTIPLGPATATYTHGEGLATTREDGGRATAVDGASTAGRSVVWTADITVETITPFGDDRPTGRVTLNDDDDGGGDDGGGIRVTARPGRDRPPCCTDVDDPFDDESPILDLVDAVPDSVTEHNVGRFLSVLSFIPAADIASKFTPAAVSKAGIPRRRHRHRHGLPRRHPREDRRENVGVSLSLPQE